jgi:hypothetical protein
MNPELAYGAPIAAEMTPSADFEIGSEKASYFASAVDGGKGKEEEERHGRGLMTPKACKCCCSLREGGTADEKTDRPSRLWQLRSNSTRASLQARDALARSLEMGETSFPPCVQTFLLWLMKGPLANNGRSCASFRSSLLLLSPLPLFLRPSFSPPSFPPINLPWYLLPLSPLPPLRSNPSHPPKPRPFSPTSICSVWVRPCHLSGREG